MSQIVALLVFLLSCTFLASIVVGNVNSSLKSHDQYGEAGGEGLRTSQHYGSADVSPGAAYKCPRGDGTAWNFDTVCYLKTGLCEASAGARVAPQLVFRVSFNRS